jgi:hypothetical protein
MVAASDKVKDGSLSGFASPSQAVLYPPFSRVYLSNWLI